MNESSDFNFLISSKLFGVNEFIALLTRRLGYDDSRQTKWIQIQQQLDSDEKELSALNWAVKHLSLLHKNRVMRATRKKSIQPGSSRSPVVR